jgi:hypothetical protein
MIRRLIAWLIAAELGLIACLVGGSSSPAVAAGIRACTAGSLEVAVGEGTGDLAGNAGLPFFVINVGKSVCQIEGYASIRFATGSGFLPHILVTHTPNPQVYRRVAPSQVSLAPGQPAAFGLTYGTTGPALPTSSCVIRSVAIVLPATKSRVFDLSVDINACSANLKFGETAFEHVVQLYQR